MQPTRSVSTIITLITLTSAKTHANTCYVINLGKLPAISIIKQKKVWFQLPKRTQIKLVISFPVITFPLAGQARLQKDEVGPHHK